MENDDAWGRWYDRNEENERMAQSNLDFAHKQGYNEGRDDGIIIGRDEGIEIGSKKKEREMVMSMYNQKATLEFISNVSGLTIPEIEAIINNYNNNSSSEVKK